MSMHITWECYKYTVGMGLIDDLAESDSGRSSCGRPAGGCLRAKAIILGGPHCICQGLASTPKRNAFKPD